ncbi:recombinase RecA [candidate division WOR-3 bacterium]|nr:recombinase RecA [candidate division WOR-3 bacterium]
MAKSAGKEALGRENFSDKEKAIESAMKLIEKQFGKGSIMRLGDDTKVEIPAIPTGSLTLDAALGVGGIPRGRITEIFGQEASGKTTLALHIVANAQKAGGKAAYIDAEHALDPVYAEKLGVNVEDLIVSQPDTGEQALEISDLLVRSGGLDILVVDSVAALVPADELNGEMGDAQIGLQARLMSKAMRKLTGGVSKSGTAAVFINQVRYKIGIMMGNPTTTPGGLALKFHSSCRLEIKRIGTLKVADQAVGNEIIVKVVKNKVAPPFREAHFDILFNEGISKHGEIIDKALELNLLKRSGTWYSYKDENIGQGKENTRNYLKEHSEISSELENAIRKELGIEIREK